LVAARLLRPWRRARVANVAPTAVVLALVGVLLSGCGSSSPSAAQKVCNDRATLNSALSTVTSDLKSGNFSQAKKDFAPVSDAFTNLKQSAQNLKAEEGQALSPQINDLTTTVTNVQSSQSLSELGTNLTSLKSQVQALSTQITNTLKCS
jgi:hypothetical protein